MPPNKSYSQIHVYTLSPQPSLLPRGEGTSRESISSGLFVDLNAYQNLVGREKTPYKRGLYSVP